MSISPAHRTLTPVQTGLQMAAVPQSFNAVWDRARLLSLLWKSAVTNVVRPDKKRHCPLTPRPLRAGTECDAATHKPVGYQPHCAHTPSAGAERRCHGTPLWDSFPRPARGPAAVISSGPGSRDERGTEGLDRGGGVCVGGGSTDPF